MKTPRLTLAHVGPLAPQSEHRRLSSSFISAVRIRLCSSFCALLTLFLLLPDMMAGYAAPAHSAGLGLAESTAISCVLRLRCVTTAHAMPNPRCG